MTNHVSGVFDVEDFTACAEAMYEQKLTRREAQALLDANARDIRDATTDIVFPIIYMAVEKYLRKRKPSTSRSQRASAKRSTRRNAR